MKKFFKLFIIFTLTVIIWPWQSAAAVTITDLSVDIVGTDGFIAWFTSEPATGCVQFGLSRDYMLQSCAVTGFTNNHELRLSNLQEETLYHFRLVSATPSGVEVASFDGTFETDKRSDTTKPEISNLNIAYVGSNNAFITWETNEKAAVRLEYGFGSSELNKFANSRRGLEHEAHLTRLQPGATYFYRLRAEDEDKNVSFSSIQSFRTSLNERVDQELLRITQVRPVSPNDNQIGETSVRLTWRNSRPASGQVIYGTNPERLNQRVNTDSRRTFQEITITKLRPSTVYYFRINQRDILGQRADMPAAAAALSFTTKTARVILGTAVTPSGQGSSPVERAYQPSVVTNLRPNGPRVLGAFTSIYTPAAALIKSLHSPKIYAVINRQRHWLMSPDLFKSYGYNFGDVKIVSMSEIDNLPEATLVKIPNQSTVYYLYRKQNLKIAIPDARIFESYANNRWSDVVTLSQEDLEGFADAKLVKTQDSNTVFLLENNSRRPFASQEAIARFGFNEAQVVIINNAHLKARPLGAGIK